MADGNLRFNRSAVPVEHASARGRVLRNASDFTRGSQLIGHQFYMFMAGVRVPFLIWLALFVATYWIMLSSVMGEHEIQLCAYKLYADLWDWIGFDPLKIMNLKMPDDSMRRVPMGAIPYLVEVRWAWAKATHALIGSFSASLLFALPIIWWFIRMANKRGSEILRERHERGAMLVPKDVLLADIAAHNRIEFEKSVAQLLPGKTPKEVLKMPFVERKAAGIHHPYFLAGVPYPHGLEQSHTVVVGTTGAGKTTVLRNIVKQIRARRDSAVIFDLTGAYVEAFYNPETDIILNPNDERCPSWSLFADCKTKTEFTAAAQALVPSDGNASDPFWVMAARTLMIEMCVKLQEAGCGTNRALADNLMTADLKRVHKILERTIADPITAPEAARMAEGVRSVLNTNANSLLGVPEDGELFSIAEWMRRSDKPGSILFVSARHVDLAMNKALLTLWMDIAINTLMTLPRTRNLRTWFIFDELGALHRLSSIENGLQTARGFGGAMVLGLHSFARLQAIYGREGAENLTSLARTKLILANADRKTAEACAEFIGNREVRQMDEAYSYGYNNLRDASTLTPRKQVEPLVIADDITNLPSLHGFLKYPDGFPAARVEVTWEHYPQVAEGFMIRAQQTKPAAPAKPDQADSETPAGGREMGEQIEQVEPSKEAAEARRRAAALALSGLIDDEKEEQSPADPIVANRAVPNVPNDDAQRADLGRLEQDLSGKAEPDHHQRGKGLHAIQTTTPRGVSDAMMRELSADFGPSSPVADGMEME